MKVFNPFVNKYPPGHDLRKPTSGMLVRFRGDYMEMEPHDHEIYDAVGTARHSLI